MDKAGWWSTRDEKKNLLTQYKHALENGYVTNRSEQALNECLEYHFFPDGSVEHVAAKDILDPSGTNDNHGDIVIADALCYRGMSERVVKRDRPIVVPKGSFYDRMQNHLEKEQEKGKPVIHQLFKGVREIRL